MAYFPNGSAGECFDRQCFKCILDGEPCPISFVQVMFNYDACNNEVATDILNSLVDDDGTCRMFKQFNNIFKKENQCLPEKP